MKMKGQYGEFDYLQPAVKRQIEISEGERISVRIESKQVIEEGEVLSYFIPGVLTLEWRSDTTLDQGGL